MAKFSFGDKVEVLVPVGEEFEWIPGKVAMGWVYTEDFQTYQVAPDGKPETLENSVVGHLYGDERDTIRTPRKDTMLYVVCVYWNCPYCEYVNTLEAMPQGDDVQCQECGEIADIDRSHGDIELPGWLK